MSDPIKDLRAQRALIQKHLNWLDAQIEKSEAEPANVSDETDIPLDDVPVESSKADDNEIDSSALDSTSYELTSDTELSTNVSDIRKAQIGCFIIFTVGILLFLFLLFGLPYFLD